MVRIQSITYYVISKIDLKEYTSYLTRRPLITNINIDKKITYALLNLWSKKKFFKHKLEEQKNRHIEFYSTAYNLEPNLKESPGTLRDFQTALWILQHCFNLISINEVSKSNLFKNEVKDAVNAYNFIKSLRFATNIIANKNRLDFETQVEISNKSKVTKNKTNMTKTQTKNHNCSIAHKKIRIGQLHIKKIQL